MQRCSQTETQSVLEHGFSVNSYFRDLIADKQQLFWRLPSWFDNYREKLLVSLHPIEVTDHYTIYHDCGKPYCLVSDDKGSHFPNHARLSQKIYFDLTGDELVSRLIGWDMVLHTCTAAELDQHLTTWARQDAATLLLAALAEIHSNAAMFGGIESISFKIKWKHLSKRGKKVCKHLFGEKV